MRLTAYTDYSLRTLIYLALNGPGLATINDIARSYGISRNHLMKVAHQLGVVGYVATVRGKNGGLRLARPATAINLGDVVRRMEPDLALVPCFNPAGTCRIRSVCTLKGVLGEALGAFLAVLDRYSLADLLAPQAALAALLALPPAAPKARAQRHGAGRGRRPPALASRGRET